MIPRVEYSLSLSCHLVIQWRPLVVTWVLDWCLWGHLHNIDLLFLLPRAATAKSGSHALFWYRFLVRTWQITTQSNTFQKGIQYIPRGNWMEVTWWDLEARKVASICEWRWREKSGAICDNITRSGRAFCGTCQTWLKQKLPRRNIYNQTAVFAIDPGPYWE